MRKSESSKSIIITQGIPLALTVVIFLFFSGVLYVQIHLLNRFTSVDIIQHIRWSDVIIGMTIYLKTAVDFAIFIGNLMAQFRGWKNRIAIEIGTAAGNAVGTLIILTVWNFFRNIDWLLALMVFVASLVLLRLAEDGLEHITDENQSSFLKPHAQRFEATLHSINSLTGKFLNIVIPNVSMKSAKSSLTFLGLLSFSFTIPFILGLDDFAGYVPLFNIVNIFGFAIGVFAGHMILNIFLFLSPKRTINAVKNPIISFLGSVAFVLLAIWGFFEVYRILFIH